MTSSDDLIASARTLTGAVSRIPKRRLALVTCMDARIDPFRILRVSVGDIHVIRNAGGIVTDDVVRSLVVSQRFLDTNQITVMMHTECGMAGFDDDGAAEQIADETGSRPLWRFGGFADLDSEVRRGVDLLRSSVHLPHRDRIAGVVYDVARKGLRTVVP